MTTKVLLSVVWDAMCKRHEFGSQMLGAAEIAAWMWDDISGEGTINELLEKFNAVASGKIEGGYLGTGNAHYYGMLGDWIILDCQFVDERKVLLTHTQIVAALENYRAFLKADKGDPNRPPPPFEVEYEADGDEAVARYEQAGGLWGFIESK